MVKKQPKKRRWNKADIGDVEDALEDERRIQKMKKPKGADDDGELFTVDTKGSFEGISKSNRRELARAKLFPPKPGNIGMSATELAKIQKAERQVEAARRPTKPEAADVFDLWGAPPASAKASNVEFKAIRPQVKNKAPCRAPGTLNQKVGIAPAVLPAHEGQSMNPHRGAYEDLACMAAATELEKEREQDELNRKMRPITHELREAVGIERLNQMDEEEKMQLYKELQLKKSAVEDEEDTGSHLSKRKKWQQKAEAIKKKHSSLKKKKHKLDTEVEQEKAQQRLNKSVGELGTTLKSIKAEDKLHSDRRKYKQNLRDKRNELEVKEGVVPKKRKLGGGQYVEQAAIVPDPEAGARGLRSMPLRTSAIKERLSSVVRRGLLPPPSEATREKQHWHKRKNNKLKRNRRFISPLLKDNLLLR